MTQAAQDSVTTTQPKDEKFARHQRWGGTYLVVADESEEFPVALEYAAKMANANKCRVGVLFAIEKQDFQHWGNVEARMHQEQRAQAEKLINEACLLLQDKECAMPSVYIEEGERFDVLASAIEADEMISMLILGGGTQGSSPGPLVSHFSAKGLSRLRVPVMIVPDHLGL